MKKQYKFLIISISIVLVIFLVKSDKFIAKKDNGIEEDTNNDVENLQKEEVEKELKGESEEDMEEKKILTKDDPEYWTQKLDNKDLLLMDESEISKFNESNFEKHDFIVNLRDYESTIIKQDLTGLINSFSVKPNETRYDSRGNTMNQEYFNKLYSNLNLENIEDSTDIRYGLTINRSQIRKFPTTEASYKKKDDILFDRFVETAIYPWEPLIIYCESQDGQWYFGRMYNYIGWIPKEDIALGTKDEIFNKIDSEFFLIVIDRQISIDNILFDMGTKIPLIDESKEDYTILIALKDENEKVKFEEKKIDKTEEFNKGYLDYTRENIIKQGFKFNGEPYGWGGMNGTRDCSAFIMDIHRTFGINLPRNASQQGIESIGRNYNIDDIENLPPGSSLYMPGHTMLYLGEDEGEHYMIHQFQGYYEDVEGKFTYINMMKTAVTSVNIKTSTGKTYKELINSAKEFLE